MLALTRKKGESLVLNNNIEITVLEIRGDQVKIGISAPKEVPIYRKEVYLQIQSENAEVSVGGVFENGEDAVLQIQAQYSLTNNGTIYNDGAINVMSGGTFTDNGTITGDGTINDQNPKAPLLAPMQNVPQKSKEQAEESELTVETPEDTEDAETSEIVSENPDAAIAPKAEETEEDNLQIDEKETE